MSAARKDVAAQIKADNPTFLVHDFPVNDPENIPAGKVFVNVFRESFSVNDSNSQITHNLKVVIATPKKMTSAAEDELDTALDALMLSLQRLPDVYWQDARRLTLGDSFPAYEITLVAITAHVYKSQILTTP